ncbi:phage head-tail connector protein [Xanthobacter dioxanivorans]|uniref:Phage head-tail connector protein n=1 Tax=Xanthobacter dioxanivorans TaxID=2528964 RepID=A0A974PJP6_9HYPH|nr:phage head-tail connector protein [Xanthobacter dioxanivorans]QRG04830.1 phage head-tail connector protein [Xanthobacter dioxanivorans]
MADLLAGPAAEPLTRAEAKAYLRIDGEAEDALLDALIPAARRLVEVETGRALIDQTWRFSRDAWPLRGIIPAPVSPVREILDATVETLDGSAVPVPAGTLTLVSDRAPALIRVDRAVAPAPARPHGGIVITVKAGYGPDAADVPADLIQAVRLVVAHFYEHRDGPGAATQLPAAALALMAPYRVVRL